MRKPWLALFAALFLVTACEATPDGAATAGANAGGGVGGATAPNFNFDPNAGGAGISSGQLAQDVADRVFFGYDSSEISSEAQAVLAKQAEWLKSKPNLNITIEGHCDERGTREYNLALGERRAAAVKNYLVSLGVPAAKINTISYGKERPAVDGADEASWAQNRRGVTVVQ
jgi:peptidoglycan-associated lipoprotein